MHRGPGYRFFHWDQRQGGGVGRSQFPQDGSSGGDGRGFALCSLGLNGALQCRKARSMQQGCMLWAPSDGLCGSSGTKATFSLLMLLLPVTDE